MTNAFPKLLTAAAAAAFLTFTPVHAQDYRSTGVGAPRDIFAERAEPQRQWMGETFRGLTMPEPTDATMDATVGSVVPDTAVRHPVPDSIIERVPEAQGYEYFHLTDGRIVLVHPEDNTIAMVIE